MAPDLRPFAAAAISVLALSVPAMAQTAETLALRSAIEAADSAALFDGVIDFHIARGLSWSEQARTTIRPYDWVFNYYDHLDLEIVIGAVPDQQQTYAYWKGWSNALTGGQWSPEDFFSDREHARILAAYNQLVLMAHEVGHALMYRYDFSHHQRHGYNLNCRELYADRIAVATMQALSADDDWFGVLEADYRALVTSLNASVAREARYDIPALKPLIADCAHIHIDLPSPDDLAAYASAFFERQRLLLSAPPVSIGNLYETLLLAPFQAGRNPGVAGTGAVETLARHDGLELGWTQTRQVGGGDFFDYRVPAFTPQGAFMTLEVSIGRSTDAAGALPVFISLGHPDAPHAQGYVGQFDLAPGDEIFGDPYAIALASDRAIIGFHLRRDVAGNADLLVSLVRDAQGNWTTRETILADAEHGAALAHGPQGEILLFIRDLFLGWQAHTLDVETLDYAIADYPRVDGMEPGLPDGRGGVILANVSTIDWLPARSPIWYRLAGSGLKGFKDGSDAGQAEFIFIEQIVRPDPRTLVVLDRLPGIEGYAVRRIDLKAVLGGN